MDLGRGKMKATWPDRRQRHVVRLEARITHADGREVGTVVTDLSLDGCSVTGSFEIGERVTMSLPKIGNFRGTVRWAIGVRAGVRFKTGAD